MSRPQDIYYDYHARQQHLRDRATAPSRQPKKRWPPAPRAEEEITSLSHEYKPALPDISGDEARSRGSIDQQPIIMDVEMPIPSSTSNKQRLKKTIPEFHKINASVDSVTSDEESSGPETPTDSEGSENGRNQDRRYVFVPKEGIEIPLTYDEPRTPILQKNTENEKPPIQQRGRKSIPKLDTAGTKFSHDVPVRLERERSPYRATPQTKESRFSGDNLLSPDTMSPRTTPRSNHERQGDEKVSGNVDRFVQRPTRPNMARHVSAMAYPGEPASPRMDQTPFSPANSTTRDNERFAAFTREPRGLDLKPPPSPRRSSAMPAVEIAREEKLSAAARRQSSVQPPRALSISTEIPSLPSMNSPTVSGLQNLNALLSSPLSARRHASPRNSPRNSPQGSTHSSPYSSPPRTPPAETQHPASSHFGTSKPSASQPMLSSPLHPLNGNLEVHDRLPHSQRPQIRSRQTSPMPASRADRLDIDPFPRIDVRSPSPAGHHHRSSTYNGEGQRSRSRVRGSSPAPPPQSQTLMPHGSDHRRRSSSAVDIRLIKSSSSEENGAESPLQPQNLKPASTNRAASAGAPPATLPPCPRSTPVAGYNDWYSLDNNSSFKICPSCRQAVSSAGYGRYLVPIFSKAPENLTRCSFSLPWIRMAYLLLLKKRSPNINLLYDMVSVSAKTQPCPGNISATREWYRIADLDTDRNIPGFYACPHCVKSLETLFPVLKDIFIHSSRSRHSLEGHTCNLRTDGSRFATYVDLLEEIANQANEYRRPPNIYRFVELAKKMSSIPRCARDDMLRGSTWHIIPSLPEFTACAECFEDVVYPLALQGLPLAVQFDRKARSVPSPQQGANPHGGVSCQLYSIRMRKVFSKAAQEDDFEYLEKKAVARWKVERELQGRILEAQSLGRRQREEAMEAILEIWGEWE